MDEINARLEALEEQDRCKYSGGYRDAYLDTIVDENQEEKVRCCTWAFVNSMGVSESNEDMFFTLFGDLADLNMLESEPSAYISRFTLKMLAEVMIQLP